MVHLANRVVDAKLAAPMSVWNRPAKKLCKFLIRHVLHGSFIIGGQFHLVVRTFRHGTRDRHFRLQTNVRHVRADHHLVRAPLGFPCVGLYVPVTERLVIERDRHVLALARLQKYLGKTFQLFCRAEHLAALHPHVELGNLGPGTVPGICDFEGRAPVVHPQVGIYKRGIGQSIAERIPYPYSRRVIIPVSDKNAFAIFGISLLAREIAASRGIPVF